MRGNDITWNFSFCQIHKHLIIRPTVNNLSVIEIRFQGDNRDKIFLVSGKLFLSQLLIKCTHYLHVIYIIK